jgi:outer membrane protein assembly factor BamD
MLKNAFILSLIAVSLVFQVGCSTTSISETDPSALFKDAEEDIQSDHYQIAIEKLRTVKNKYPYSKYAIDAQLRIADVYFIQELYADAAAAYEAFRDLHPKHEKAAYAMYRAGKSYLNESPSNVARDLTPVQKALDAYSDFLRRFPNAPEAAEAKKDIEHGRNLLAEKELYIANFYLKRDFYDSAKPRYKKIIDLYPETDAAKNAEKKLAEIDAVIFSEESSKKE